MENEKLLKRLIELEAELEELRQSLEPPEKNTWIRRLERFSRFLSSHWSLVTLIIAAATALVAFIFFEVDPFESYRAIKTTRELSEIYSTVGDELLFRNEWDAAEDAYRTALEIDKNNIPATYGLFKAQVFQPLEGQNHFVFEVADAKLDYLELWFENEYQTLFLRGYYYLYQGNYPEANNYFSDAIASVEREDFTAAYLRGFYYFSRRDYVSAISSFRGAIAPDEGENAAAAYIMRGYVKQQNSDLEGACMDYNAAIEKEPQNSIAHNNLGYCLFLQGNFLEAYDHFRTAYFYSPKLLSVINLGDALMFAGEPALDLQKGALEIIEDPSLQNERYIEGEWTFNYMPLYATDDQSINYHVSVYDITQKKVFIHYNLSLGYALNHNFQAATREFHIGNQLNVQEYLNLYFVNKMQSLRNHVEMDDDVREWFETHEQMLSTD